MEEMGNKAKPLVVFPGVDRMFFAQGPGQGIPQSCIPSAEEKASQSFPLLLCCCCGKYFSQPAFRAKVKTQHYTLMTTLSFADACPSAGSLSHPKTRRLTG